MRRKGFTLVELLVTIVVIGILSGLVFGALQRAQGVSRVVHTKSTIAKLNASLMDRWDSYRTKRLPVDPMLILANIKTNSGTTYTKLQGYISAMANRRIANYAAQGVTVNGQPIVAYTNPPPAVYEPLSVPWNAPPKQIGINANGNPILMPVFPNRELAAAVRLIGMRELIRFEMPQHLEDFIDFSTPPPWGLRTTDVLLVPPPIATTYLIQVNAAAANGATLAQLQSNDSAELLYMILTIGSTDSGMFGEQMPNQDLGDVDGDGLPEFQDAWAVTVNSFTPKGQANSPINFLRWAPGFVSDMQPDPTFPNVIEFSASHHDYFDPLKLDVPKDSGSLPRGFQLYPLIYSAGPDGIWDISQNVDPAAYADPYAPYTSGILPGTTGPAASDNITNHELDTRTGR